MEPIIAGNWKMNKEPGESRALVQELMQLTGDVKDRIMILIPPFTSLPSVGELVRNSRFKLGGQNMHWERSGAYTGEISGLFLKAVGCEYVIIGHSERRHIMGEDDETINKKLKTALEIGLIPILCVGEKGEEKDGGKTEAVIQRQIKEGMNRYGRLVRVKPRPRNRLLKYTNSYAVCSGSPVRSYTAAA